MSVRFYPDLFRHIDELEDYVPRILWLNWRRQWNLLPLGWWCTLPQSCRDRWDAGYDRWCWFQEREKKVIQHWRSHTYMLRRNCLDRQIRKASSGTITLGDIERIAEQEFKKFRVSIYSVKGKPLYQQRRKELINCVLRERFTNLQRIKEETMKWQFFGKHVLCYRYAAGANQDEAAELCECCSATVGAAERGVRKLRARTFAQLCDGLGMKRLKMAKCLVFGSDGS